ncbi:unnamed protein product [Sphenostylis stenocarpa]|uniref:Uncharacterized protein n=1 Tax=Sphenostylis stenocarpa TaxID=92480 RepID=A0AA86TAV7_9FABA|nr:unnamed protein product [Sphenostylis stenocarpa]
MQDLVKSEGAGRVGLLRGEEAARKKSKAEGARAGKWRYLHCKVASMADDKRLGEGVRKLLEFCNEVVGQVLCSFRLFLVDILVLRI